MGGRGDPVQEAGFRICGSEAGFRICARSGVGLGVYRFHGSGSRGLDLG